MYQEIVLETQTFDLDWNRHVTSRTYENFAGARLKVKTNVFPDPAVCPKNSWKKS